MIHAVGPRWFGGKEGEPALLRSCYLNALEAARERGCESIAFPLISSGIFGCPKQIALRIAVDAIRDFLAENEMLVCLVIYNRSEFPLEDGLRRDISKYINDSFLTDTTDTEELSACAPTGAAPGRFAYEDEARFVRGGKQGEDCPDLSPKPLCTARSVLRRLMQSRRPMKRRKKSRQCFLRCLIMRPQFPLKSH